MNKVNIVLCFSVFLLLQIPSSKGSFCTKTGGYYAAQHYCSIPYVVFWIQTACFKYGYRLVMFYEKWKECCPGYKGKDCTTPICLEKCSPGFICSSPDMCTVDPMAANVLYTNSTSTNSSDVGVAPTAEVSVA
ncbi:uncharacterized protein LOC111118423 [Crassostrea virginica]